MKEFDYKKDLQHKLNSASLSTYNEFMIDLYTNKCDQVVELDIEEDTNQKELIEQDLDSQPDDNQLDEFISSIKTPETIPSYKSYLDWKSSLVTGDISTPLLENALKNKYKEYIQSYRKQLREWWFNRQKNKVNEQSTDTRS